MKRMTKGLIVACGLLLAPSTGLAQLETPQVYVALGDSVAAGVTPYEDVDAGYTDIIANKLQQNGLLFQFSKDFAVPGFATSNILELLDNEDVREVTSQATLITLSAGANDVLPLVNQDERGETVAYSQLPADFALNRMRIQYGEILDEIREINPDARIVAVGYFFPYPHVRDTQKEGVVKMLDTVNEIIEQEATNRDIEFVSVADSFGSDAVEFLPNPTDVHPNQAGYVEIANDFFDTIDPRFDVTEADIPPNPGLSPFIEELLEQQGGQPPGGEEQPAGDPGEPGTDGQDGTADPAGETDPGGSTAPDGGTEGQDGVTDEPTTLAPDAPSSPLHASRLFA